MPYQHRKGIVREFFNATGNYAEINALFSRKKITFAYNNYMFISMKEIFVSDYATILGIFEIMISINAIFA